MTQLAWYFHASATSHSLILPLLIRVSRCSQSLLIHSSIRILWLFKPITVVWPCCIEVYIFKKTLPIIWPVHCHTGLWSTAEKSSFTLFTTFRSLLVSPIVQLNSECNSKLHLLHATLPGRGAMSESALGKYRAKTLKENDEILWELDAGKASEPEIIEETQNTKGYVVNIQPEEESNQGALWGSSVPGIKQQQATTITICFQHALKLHFLQLQRGCLLVRSCTWVEADDHYFLHK